MILSQLVVVSPQTVDLLLPLGVGVDQPHDGVPQLVVEGVAGIIGGIEVVVHPVAACKIKTDQPDTERAHSKGQLGAPEAASIYPVIHQARVITKYLTSN